ncbi:MAG: pseudouridine-5'-phosphate glycosidase [Gaiellaceae bacterium]|nr:pseudouridine-5'-phosphate glycosidase [Gaiellaceae bacterium]
MSIIRISDEVQAALDAGRPLVALETTLVAHGFPAPDGLEVALASEEAVRSAGAVPATIGVVAGEIRVGLARRELEELTPQARKLGPRDLAPCVAARATGATTVGGTLAVARSVGIRFLGTGGIGGVHRGFPTVPDVSADLAMIARAQALVVCSGAKSLLDVPATVELLESLGVPVLGFRTSTLPLFYAAEGGPPVQERVEDAATAARIAADHWSLDGGGIVLATPPPSSLDVSELVEEALSEATRAGISGPAVTPFVLALLHERSGGATLRANRDLVVANARLAGEIAVAFGAL